MSPCVFCDSFRSEDFDTFPIGDFHVRRKRTVINDIKHGIVAVMSPEQLAKGHVLVISKGHVEGITDPRINSLDFKEIIGACHRIAITQKKAFGSSLSMIHLASLGEGVKHLHFHVLPRYELNEKEQEFFWNLHTGMDNEFKVLVEGERRIGQAVTGARVNFGPGFWYWAFHETNWHVGKPGTQEEAEILADEIEGTADHLRDLIRP